MGPSRAGRTVSGGDVAEPPLDLSGGVGLPVGAGAGHLVPGKRLRDAVGAAVAVHRPFVPAALLVPQLLQAAPLVGPPARGDHLLTQGLVAAGVGVGAGRERLGVETVATGRLAGDHHRAEPVAAFPAVDEPALAELLR